MSDLFCLWCKVRHRLTASFPKTHHLLKASNGGRPRRLLCWQGNTPLWSAAAFDLHTHSHIFTAILVRTHIYIIHSPASDFNLNITATCPSSTQTQVQQSDCFLKNPSSPIVLTVQVWNCQLGPHKDRRAMSLWSFDVLLWRRDGVICKSFHCPPVIKSDFYLYCRHTALDRQEVVLLISEITNVSEITSRWCIYS